MSIRKAILLFVFLPSFCFAQTKKPITKSDLIHKIQISHITILKYIQSIHYFKMKYNLIFNIDDFLEDINLQCDFNNEAIM